MGGDEKYKNNLQSSAAFLEDIATVEHALKLGDWFSTAYDINRYQLGTIKNKLEQISKEI